MKNGIDECVGLDGALKDESDAEQLFSRWIGGIGSRGTSGRRRGGGGGKEIVRAIKSSESSEAEREESGRGGGGEV